MLRDVREFYRLLFRFRFHYLEYQTEEGAIECIRIFLNELNIPLPSEDHHLHSVFRYLHQSHKFRFSAVPNGKEKVLPLEVIEKYNENYRSAYMKDEFGARLLYFVFKNFMPEY